MNFMLEAIGRDIGVMWNRFVWHQTIAQMQADMVDEVWAEYRLRRTFPSSYRVIRKVVDDIKAHGPLGQRNYCVPKSHGGYL